MAMNVIHVDKIQSMPGGVLIHTKPNGMTVHDLIWELQQFPSDEMVYMYTENGDMVHVCRAMKDKRRLVLF